LHLFSPQFCVVGLPWGTQWQIVVQRRLSQLAIHSEPISDLVANAGALLLSPKLIAVATVIFFGHSGRRFSHIIDPNKRRLHTGDTASHPGLELADRRAIAQSACKPYTF
jgi:thiamine biosynthesis lipoprotein ApbE